MIVKLSRWQAFWWRVLDFADDVLDVVGSTTLAIGRGLKRAAKATWRPIRENARKLIPSRGARWTFLYVPGFTVGLLFALQTFGLVDMRDYVLEVGAKSAPILIAVALTMLVTTVLGWNLDNEYRARLQRLTHRNGVAWLRRFFAFGVLAGEFVAIAGVLCLFLWALLVAQG